MKITPSKLADLKKLISTKSLVACLIYGEEDGVKQNLVHSISTLFNTQDSEIIKLYNDEKDIHIEALINELKTQSFFSPSKLIIANGIKFSDSAKSEDIPKLKTLQDIEPDSKFLIIIESKLDGRSNLRKIFEESSNLAAIACYPATKEDFRNHISQFSKNHNLTLQEGVVDFITNNFQGNIALLSTELDKLVLYKHNNPSISIQDCQNIMSFSAENNFFTIAADFATLDPQLISTHLFQCKTQLTPLSTLIYPITTHMLKLQKMLYNIEYNSSTPQQEIKTAFIHFSQTALFQKQLSLWSHTKITNFLKRLCEVELKSRQNSHISDLIIENFLTLSHLIYRK